MHLTLKKSALFILGLTSILCSRALFVLFDDPEGPNLLIVMVMGVVVYALSLIVDVYFPLLRQGGWKRVLLLIFFQILVVTALYFLLR